MAGARTSSSSSSGRLGVEALSLAGNLVSCEVSFALVWLPLHFPSPVLMGEVVEEFAITSAFYLPVLFSLSYLAVRILMVRRSGWPWSRTAARPSMWLVGALLGPLLALADTYTRLFWVLNPFLRTLGR